MTVDYTPPLAVHLGAPPGRGDTTSGLSITLDHVAMTVAAGGWMPPRGRKTILKDVSLHIRAGEFVGILGASGSGKSTLIKAVAGLVETSSGRILLDSQSVSAHDLRHDRRIAYLPQDVVIHEQLTLRQALRYIAELKGISAAGGRAVTDTIARATAHTGLDERLDVSIRRLSGGQRKRAALAGELIGDPQLLLLDEATSGLDPATEGEMMRLFRSLADEGRTVVCITHFPNRLALCDRLVYLIDGQVVFNGSRAELEELFGATGIEEVYLAQASRAADDWRQTYERRPAGRAAAESVATALAVADASGDRSAPALPAAPSGPTQLRTLVRRYARLQTADWPNLLLLFAQAPAIALMIAATYGSIRADFYQLHAAQTKEVIFLLVIAMLWCAGTVAVREIVKEESIVRHEVRFGLRLWPYLLSKLLLLSLLVIAQAAVLLAMVRMFTDLTGGFPAQFAIMAATSAAGLTLGLMVSTVSGSSERAMTILPVLLITQAVFSGGLARLDGLLERLSQILVPAYWALDGLRSTFSTGLTFATYPNAPGTFQPPILGTGGPLAADLLALVLHGSLFSWLAYLALRARLGGSGSQRPG